MSSRELVVLGTASQVPTKRRNHNGYVLRWDGHTILFDPGEGTQRQLLHAGVTSPSIDRICITHVHGDHCLGLPGVLMRRAVDEAALPVALHYPASAGTEIAHLRRTGLPAAALAFATSDAGCVEHPVTVGVTPEVIASDPGGGWRLLAAALDHRIDAVGYRLEEPDGVRFVTERLAAAGVSGPDVGRLLAQGSLNTATGRVHLADVSVPRPGQSFAFVMDTRPCAGALALAQGVDLLVVESTYLARDAALAREYRHLTARQAGELAAQAGVRRLALTHFSRRYGDEPDSGELFAGEAREVFPDVVALSDLDVVPFPSRRPAA